MNEKQMNEKIEELNLVALRKYACPRVSNQKEWYLNCMDCKGLEGCPAGKRAVDIVESETSPEELAYHAHQKMAGDIAGQAHHRRAEERIRKLFEGTTSTEERLARYLMFKNADSTGKAAYMSLCNWMKLYPDLSKKYDMLAIRSKITWNLQRLKIFELRKMFCKDLVETDTDDDQVSIEDFLKEESSEDVPVAETVTIAPDPSITAGISQEGIRIIFGKKRLELKNKIAYITNQIETLTAQKGKYISQIEMLDSTATLFGMAPAKPIDP